jgi:hypothetical protein
MQSLRRWCAAHGKGVSLLVVKVAVKGGKFANPGNRVRGFLFCNSDLQAMEK